MWWHMFLVWITTGSSVGSRELVINTIFWHILQPFYAFASDRYMWRHYAFGLSVRERPSVRPCVSVSWHASGKVLNTISYNPMDAISPNFGWWCSWGEQVTFWRPSVHCQGQGCYEVRCEKKLWDPISPERFEGSQPNLRSRSRSRSRLLQDQIFKWVIAAGGGSHIDAWTSKYHLVLLEPFTFSFSSTFYRLRAFVVLSCRIVISRAPVGVAAEVTNKCQTPQRGHRLRTPPTDELTTILQLVVQQIHHQRTEICHIPTSWHVDMLGC